MLLDHLLPLSSRHHTACDDLLLLGIVHQTVTAVLVLFTVQAESLYIVELFHDVDVFLLLVKVPNNVGNLSNVLLVVLRWALNLLE